MKKLFFIAFIMFSLTALADAELVCPTPKNTLPSRYQANLNYNITYCSPDGVDLKLDIAQPKAAGRFPVIIFLHGGAWVSGSKDGFSFWLKQAAEKGFVAVAINYRLTQQDQLKTKNQFPFQAVDVRCAVRFLKASANTYKINPDKIALFGESAGAHLALMAGLAPEPWFKEHSQYLNQSNSVQAIGTFYAPTDLNSLWTENPNMQSNLEMVFRGKPGSEQFSFASPINYLNPQSPPLLNIHGTLDDVIPYSQALHLKDKSLTMNSRHQLITCDNEKHGFSEVNRQKAFDHIFNFFNLELNR